MNTVTAMSTQEFESLVIQTVDQRMGVWVTQLLDMLGRDEDNNQIELQPAFAQSLTQSMQQAKAGNMTSLAAFRQQLTHE